MDRVRTRKPTLKSQPSKATREEFKPAFDWAEDSSNRLLHVQLPGFKKKDIKVQLDSAGKLLTKGSRHVSGNKYLYVDQSFDVPEDTITEKISWRFEGGRLTLIMPKKVVEEREAAREAAAIQEVKPYAGEEEEEDIDEEEGEEDIDEEEEEAEAFTEEKKDAKTGGLVVLWIRRIFAWIVTLLIRPSKRTRSHAPMSRGALWSPWKKEEAEAVTEVKKDAKTGGQVGRRIRKRISAWIGALLIRPSKATREEFKAAVDWAEDSSNRLLHVQLPGFKRENIMVHLDSAGTLLIAGSRKVSDKKYLDVDQSFDVPEDTITEKIRWRFKGGRLTFIMPKKVVEEREAAREAAAIQEEKPYAGVEKKEEEGLEDKKAEAFTEEKKNAKTDEETKDEHLHEEKHTAAGEEQSVPSQKEKPELEGEKKDDGPAIREEKKDDDRNCKEKKSEKVEEKKRRDTDQTETTKSGAMEKEKEEEPPIKSTKAKIKDIRRRISAWIGAGDSWLDSGSLDYILEKLNRNWKVIAIAVVAFSVGLFVSQKLKTRGKGEMDTFLTMYCVISHCKVM